MTRQSTTWSALDESRVRRLATICAKLLQPGDVVSLEGDLGSGKTFFVRHVAAALGIRDPITSPTFVLQKIYTLPAPVRGIATLIHYDVYRLATYDELAEIGFEEIPPGTVVFVEWGDRFLDRFPTLSLRIRFEITTEDRRDVTLEAPPEILDRVQLLLSNTAGSRGGRN